ncbi:uncharacterized protein M421DRAFT_159978 [Didymella exigua CBS 183.55]|uniref:Uncharacterized protein n=1 Tax=Didymella exigua CBS 183.55 TaxID=1150837 RepID=A0A6A5RSC0_9PLEO|nr:uncharacterized protein M421DRAFT_159978 [Didymella exigua CBS 183.55]KAF1928397.1 hypothetical protein M421DRAFT_159978 [Didymella exigua CBS 183.55]
MKALTGIVSVSNTFQPSGPKLMAVPVVLPAPKGATDVGSLNTTSAVPVGNSERLGSGTMTSGEPSARSSSGGSLIPGATGAVSAPAAGTSCAFMLCRSIAPTTRDFILVSPQ